MKLISEFAKIGKDRSHEGNSMLGRKNLLLSIFLAVPLQVLAQDYSWKDCLQLKASDHTAIISLIMKNADVLIPLAKTAEIPLDDP